MTISSSTRKAGPTAGNGVTDTIPFTFKVFTEADLVVVKRVTATDVETTLALTTDYTVSLNADQDADPGGDIVIVDPATDWPTGTTITVTSELSPTQAADITNRGGFYASVINAALDKLTILVQQVKGLADRSLKFPISDSGYVSTLPGKAELANNVLAFDSNGDPVAGPGATNMQALIDAAESVIANSNAGAVSAVTTSLPAHPSGATYDWSFTDVQGFINQLVNGVGTGLNERGVVFKYLPRSYAGAGHPSYLLQGSIRIGDASDSDGYISLSTSVSGIYLYRYKANALRAEIVCEETNGFMVAIPGSTSGYGYVIECKKDQGYISLISATGVQTKVAEWGSNACFKPSKALQLPSYANLAAINAAIASPVHGMMVMTTSQGAAIYKTSSWVRVVDETTAIT